MADEISITIQVVIANGDYKRTFAPGTDKITQTGFGASGGIYSISTSEENPVFTDITTEGWIVLHNHDSTNFVKWGASATTPTLATIGRLEAGESACFRVEPGVTLRMQADTAACDVEIWLLED